ncbi:hypothetical protein [Bradyrhizobium sp. HKCCYLS2033]|uniref:hypothetical protein n=1 Tax=Bradyrhizobium sp. HKCCYLS2033 TaxID=3420739 RepID=UPI003EBF9BB0
MKMLAQIVALAAILTTAASAAQFDLSPHDIEVIGNAFNHANYRYLDPDDAETLAKLQRQIDAQEGAEWDSYRSLAVACEIPCANPVRKARPQ